MGCEPIVVDCSDLNDCDACPDSPFCGDCPNPPYCDQCPNQPYCSDPYARSSARAGFVQQDFACGAERNTCTVEQDGQTRSSDTYGVEDVKDTDTEYRWRCRSDNGTVKSCSLAKDD